MSFQVSVGGTNLSIDAGQLKGFRDDLNLAFALERTLVPWLGGTLATVAATHAKTTVAYTSEARSWQPSGGPVTFGLQAGASGTLELLTGTVLLDFADGLDSPTKQTVTVPVGKVCVRLTLEFTISANASAAWSGGAYGVKAALNTGVAYAVSFGRMFSVSAPVGEAVASVFQGFVLPLHAETLAQMEDGDLLQHEFDGNLHLGFGAYAGFDTVLYAGQAAVDVARALGSPLATLSAGVRPTVKGGASLDLSFSYASRFEVLLSRLDGVARMQVFRSATSEVGVKLKAGLEFDSNVTASVAGHGDVMAASLVSAAGGPATVAGAVLQQGLSAAVGEVSKYFAEVNDRLAAWLARGDGLRCNLEAAIDVTRSRTVLAGYSFDLEHAAFGRAWAAAVTGDLLAAFATGAVTLDAGSGLEREYQQKTSCKLNIFNLWNWSSWNQFSSTMRLVYAGGNRFHLAADVGRTTETDVAGTMRSLALYFAAEADVLPTGTDLMPDLRMHVDLLAAGQPKEAVKIAGMLAALNAGGAASAMAARMRGVAGRPDGMVQMLFTVPMTGLQRLKSDGAAGISGGGATTEDSVNWAVFAAAADGLNAWALAPGGGAVSETERLYLRTYAAWQKLNVTCTGAGTPDRSQFGNRALWPEDFPQVQEGTRDLVRYSMFAGQAFMNFCGSLCGLVHATEVQSAGATWEVFLSGLTAAVKQGSNVDFLRPTALALMRLCMGSGVAVSGPADQTVPTAHFVVSVAL